MTIIQPITLYAKSYTNKIMYWKVLVTSAHNDKLIIHKRHGYLDSREIEHTETLPYSLSNLETIKDKVHTLISAKVNNGYRSLTDLGIANSSNLKVDLLRTLSVDKFDKNNILKSMKAKPFKTGVITYPAYCQPKLNGVRCNIMNATTENGLFGTVSEVKLISRGGIEYDVPHITKLATDILKSFSDEVVLDGELYLHGTPVTSIAGAARNSNNPINQKLTYRVFDLAIPNLDQSERFGYLEEVNKYMTTPVISTLDTYVVNSDEEAIEYAERFIEEGYEGAIIRDMNAPYYFGGRRNNMLKIKKYKVDKFKVIDVESWDKDPELGLFVLRNDTSGDIFKCTPMGDRKQRMAYLLDKYAYIGKYAKVKYYERTINGLPFHANVISIDE